MAVKKPVLFVISIICTVVVIANQCGKHAGEKKVSDENERQKDEIKKQQEKVKAFLDRITAEIENDVKKHGCSEYKNCADVLKDGQKTSGVYSIKPDSGDAFDAYCDKTAGGGWTVFQKRLDGSVNFDRGWDDYKRGFGNLSGEFWLGLDKIHRLTKQQSALRVDLEDFNGTTAYAEYRSFGVGNEADKYKLTVGSYFGTAGDSFSYHHGMSFSTRHRDHDPASWNCASIFKGAWWYNHCLHANLNGLYLKGAHSSDAHGVIWYSWKGFFYSVKRAEMKIRPFNP